MEVRGRTDTIDRLSLRRECSTWEFHHFKSVCLADGLLVPPSNMQCPSASRVRRFLCVSKGYRFIVFECFCAYGLLEPQESLHAARFIYEFCFS